MDYSKINDIIAQHPMVIMDSAGELIEFTAIPSYDEIAGLCAKNPIIHPDCEITGKFAVSDNTVLDCINEYRLDMRARGLLNAQLMGAIDDLADTVVAYYAGVSEHYIETVLDAVGDDAQSISIIFNGLMGQSDEMLAKNDYERAEAYMPTIEYMAMLYPHLAVDLERKYEENEDPMAVLEAEVQNAAEDAIFIQMAIGENEDMTLPLTQNVISVLCEIMPVFYTDSLEELIVEHGLPGDEAGPVGDVIGLLQDQLDQMKSLDDIEEGDEKILKALDQAQDWAYECYFAQMGDMAHSFIDADIDADDFKETLSLLEEWVDELAGEIGDEDADLFSYMLASLQTEIRNELRMRAQALNQCRAQGQKDKENKTAGESVFCTRSATLTPFLH